MGSRRRCHSALRAGVEAGRWLAWAGVACALPSVGMGGYARRPDIVIRTGRCGSPVRQAAEVVHCYVGGDAQIDTG